MTRYAQIIGGRAVAFFTTDRPSSDFPDIQIVAAGPEVEAGWYLVDGVLQPKPARTLDEAKEEARQRIAAARFAEETGGVTLPSGVTVQSDRESQDMMVKAIKLMEERIARGEANPTTEYKAIGGFVTLDLPSLKDVSFAVGMHVDGCFAKEAALSRTIDAATTVDEADAVVW